VSPSRRRQAVVMLQDRLGISERRACRYVGQHRSTQRHAPTVVQDDLALRAELRELSRRRPRWGYRRAHQLLLDEGWEINRKRTQRVWREEGLRVPQKRRKRQRLGVSAVPADRLRAQAPDHVWAIDFQWDQTADGHNLKLLHVVDEFTREALAIECRRRIDADHTVNVLDRLVAERSSTPSFIRCDNGPEMTANALRDWCRFSGAGSAYIEPGSPWQNPYVESFGSRVRDELLAVEVFSCLAEAQVLIEDWRQDYNHHRPHSSLGMMTPVAFAASLRQPLPGPAATAAGEGVDRRGRLTSTTQRTTRPIIPTWQQQNPAEDITPPPAQANSHSSYRGITTTTTQLSQQVDR
jgi:putative transposase